MNGCACKLLGPLCDKNNDFGFVSKEDRSAWAPAQSDQPTLTA